jgi:endonuclease III
MSEPTFPIEQALTQLNELMPQYAQPLIDQMRAEQLTPFQILVATILSLRTQDIVTAIVAPRLFAVAATPAALDSFNETTIAALIYPVGFYRTKARQLKAISRILLERFGGEVPSDLETLLTLPGVGRKTANLTVSAGFNLPAICVDIHVHRICNRWGYVATKTPDETEMRLRAQLPQHWWIAINTLLVTFGQQICRPMSPHCSSCPLSDRCPRIGVTRSR